jgi:hypothetical protein
VGGCTCGWLGDQQVARMSMAFSSARRITAQPRSSVTSAPIHTHAHMHTRGRARTSLQPHAPTPRSSSDKASNSLEGVRDDSLRAPSIPYTLFPKLLHLEEFYVLLSFLFSFLHIEKSWVVGLIIQVILFLIGSRSEPLLISFSAIWLSDFLWGFLTFFS